MLAALDRPARWPPLSVADGLLLGLESSSLRPAGLSHLWSSLVSLRAAAPALGGCTASRASADRARHEAAAVNSGGSSTTDRRQLLAPDCRRSCKGGLGRAACGMALAGEAACSATPHRNAKRKAHLVNRQAGRTGGAGALVRGEATRNLTSGLHTTGGLNTPVLPTYT